MGLPSKELILYLFFPLFFLFFSFPPLFFPEPICQSQEVETCLEWPVRIWVTVEVSGSITHNPIFIGESSLSQMLGCLLSALTKNSASFKEGCPCIFCQRHLCSDTIDKWATVHKLSSRISIQKHLYILMQSEFTACQESAGTAMFCQS